MEDITGNSNVSTEMRNFRIFPSSDRFPNMRSLTWLLRFPGSRDLMAQLLLNLRHFEQVVDCWKIGMGAIEDKTKAEELEERFVLHFMWNNILPKNINDRVGLTGFCILSTS